MITATVHLHVLRVPARQSGNQGSHRWHYYSHYIPSNQCLLITGKSQRDRGLRLLHLPTDAGTQNNPCQDLRPGFSRPTCITKSRTLSLVELTYFFTLHSDSAGSPHREYIRPITGCLFHHHPGYCLRHRQAGDTQHCWSLNEEGELSC